MSTALQKIRNIVSKTIAAFDQRQAQVKTDYRTFLREFVSAPERFGEKEVQKRLAELDVDAPQFGVDVELLEKRIALKATADTLPSVERKIADLYAKIATTNDQLKRDVEAARVAAEAAKTRHDAAVTPLQTELERARAEREQVEEAAKELTKCAPADVEAEYKAADRHYYEIKRAIDAEKSHENPHAYALDGLGKRALQLRRDLDVVRGSRNFSDNQKEQKLLQEYEEVQTKIIELSKPIPRPVDTDIKVAFEEASKRLDAARAALSAV